RRVGSAYHAGIALKPRAERGRAGRRTVRDQQTRHQAVDFIARQSYVAERVPDETREEQRDARRNGNKQRGAAERVGKRAHKIPEGINLRSDRVDDPIVGIGRLVYRERDEVFDEYGLHAVIAAARDGEQWRAAQEPRDVVNQDVFDTENQRRPQNQIRQTRLRDLALDNSLAAKIRQWRILGRAGDADMDDPADAGLPRRAQ